MQFADAHLTMPCIHLVA